MPKQIMPVCYVNKTPFSLFAIYKNVQLCSYNRCIKPSISLACKKISLFFTCKSKRNKKRNKAEDAKFYQIKTNFAE